MAQFDSIESKSAGLRAYEAARKMQLDFEKVSKAISSGDLETLAGAKARGWQPGLDGGSGWFSLAMRERSGASIRWFLDQFPRESYESGVFKASGERDGRGGESSWSLEAMIVAEDLGMRVGGMVEWVKKCSNSSESAEYFEKSFACNSAWRLGVGSKADAASACEALLCVLEHLKRSKVAMLCSQRLVELLDASGWPSASHRDGISRKIAGACANILATEALPESALTLSRAMPSERVGMSEGRLRLRGDKIAKKSALEAARRALAKASAGFSEAEYSAEQGLGLVALAIGDMRAFKLALDSGWIGRLPVIMDERFEHPDFVAWDHARINRAADRAIDLSARWKKVRDGIEAVDLSENEKKRLRSKCDAPDPMAWKPGMAKTVESTTSRLNDPIGVLLALGSGRGVGDKTLEQKVEALAKAGFSPRQAVDGDTPLGKDASDRLNALRSPSWYASLVEREVIAAASGTGFFAARSARL